MQAGGKTITEAHSHLTCPFCGAYDVDRLFVASARVDACHCVSCGAAWDEDAATGTCRDRADRASVILPAHDQS